MKQCGIVPAWCGPSMTHKGRSVIFDPQEVPVKCGFSLFSPVITNNRLRASVDKCKTGKRGA
jgi:hypothetical protein